MKRPSIPRSTFIAAIEAGISEARIDALDPSSAAKLREVGRDSKLIGAGTFSFRSDTTDRVICHCPLSKAGITDDDGEVVKRVPFDISLFAGKFDDRIGRALGNLHPFIDPVAVRIAD